MPKTIRNLNYMLSFYSSGIGILYITIKGIQDQTIRLFSENGENTKLANGDLITISGYAWMHMSLYASAIILSLFFYYKFRNKDTLFVLIATTILLILVAILEFGGFWVTRESILSPPPGY